LGKYLIVIGLVIAGIGMLITLGVPIGRFHFPIVTSIVVSIILTLLFSFFRR
jgi:hypothetical protein